MTHIVVGFELRLILERVGYLLHCRDRANPPLNADAHARDVPPIFLGLQIPFHVRTTAKSNTSTTRIPGTNLTETVLV